MPSVTKESWKNLPLPERREPLGYQAVFDDADADRLMQGLKPEAMEDKWFIYFEDGWLYLHRSWTGSVIYWLKFEGSPAGIRVTESWVNRDPGQYTETDIAYDRAMLDFLIRRMLLGQTRRMQWMAGSSSLWDSKAIGAAPVSPRVGRKSLARP
jgi:hypothetical protein